MDRANEDPPIPSTGLTVICSPETPNLDVVFVHGFTGHPVRTWTHKKGDMGQQNREDVEILEPPSRIQKLGLFSKSQQRPVNQSIYWPQELIPSTLPNARVLTYGYDTHIRHRLGPSRSTSTVYDIAWDFLVTLEANRHVEPSRPVIFIAHSLGGIVVKEMLRRSSDYYQSQTHLRHVFTSTIGVMFFGTPHSGADPRNFLHRIAEKAIKTAGFSVNEQIVNTLLPSAERLRELRDDFGPRAQQRNWIIHSFQEQVGVALLGDVKVVEDWSSTLYLPAIETTEHIGRNHMDMCRFTGPNDVEYKKVAAALHRMTESISEQSMEEQRPGMNDEQTKSLLESLRFDQIDSRQMTIKKAHAKTCKWLLGDLKYLDWLDSSKLCEHHGFLWIKGKPGTGKSTLLKFLLANSRKSMKESIVISFFFNARGDKLEKSTLGTYQSLLLQLLERIPTLESVFESLDLSVNGIHANYQWSEESLKALLEEAISRLGDSSVVCIIDALDECDERQIRDMTSFFELVGELAVSANINLRVCFSSRHYPHISMQRGLELVLEGQEGHTQDITSYVESELKIGHSKVAGQIRNDLQEKASGVFLWVVLVVEILNKEHDSGRIHALRRRLQDIPGDLHELFRDVLTRDSRNQDELILCLQWVLFAKHPLTPEELYFAILSGVDPLGLSNWDSDVISIPDMKRFILDASKGLTETTASKNPKCQFIHESVKDFLLKEHGLAKIWPNLKNDFQGQSHDRLKQCCVSYMNVGGDLYLGIDLPKASAEAINLRNSVTVLYPFLEYAVHQVLYHADVAQGCNIAQGNFIQSLKLPDWIQLNNLLEKHQTRRYKPNARLLYILAEYDASNLIDNHPSVLSFLEVEDERYRFPLLASLATGSEKAVISFVKAVAACEPPGSRLQKLCNQYYRDKGGKAKLGRNFEFSEYGSVLSSMAAWGDASLFAIVLATGKFDTNSSDKRGRTPFWHAVNRGHEAIMKLLIEEGVDPNMKNNLDFGQTLLSAMVCQGQEVAVRTLLETDKVHVNSRDDNGRTPLILAAERRDESIVKMLLDTGKVDINSQSNSGDTSLIKAIIYGREGILMTLLDTANIDVNLKNSLNETPLIVAIKKHEDTMVKLLLETGKVDVNSEEPKGRTALHTAIQQGNEVIVRMLLEISNINVDSRDSADRSPLWHAASDGKHDIVKLLLETGKVDVNSEGPHGLTALHMAIQRGNEIIVRMLLETSNINVDSRDSAGRSPLFYAAFRGKHDIVKLLLDTGEVEVDMRDHYDQTLLSYAAWYGYLTIVQLLLDTGKIEVDARDGNGDTPLLCAAYNGHTTVVKLLLETGKVDVNSMNNEGQTPRSIAAKRGLQDIVDLLDDYAQSQTYTSS